MAGQLIYYKCMNPHFLKNTAIDPNIIAPGSSNTELMIGQDSADYNGILHVRLLPAVLFGQPLRGDLTFVINVAAEGPKPKFYDPIAVCITDLTRVIGIQFRDPSEYADKTKGPYMGFKSAFGTSLTNPVEIPCNEKDDDYDFIAHYDWRRWPQIFNVKLKPNPPSPPGAGAFSANRAWGLCSAPTNGGISRSFDLGDNLDMNKEIHLVLYRRGAKEKYTINMIEVSIYEDNP